MTVLAAGRSMLFVPADSERKLSRALTEPADLVVADLEDGVAPGARVAARESLIDAWARSACSSLRCVRVNPVGTADIQLDLAAIERLKLDAIMVPKATPEALESIRWARPIVALIETPQGLSESDATARLPMVAALMLGTADLGAMLALQPHPDGLELLFARSKLVMDSAAAGIRAPFDGPHLEVNDLDGLRVETKLARRLGMGGKACIHPGQLSVVAEVFAPASAEIAWARAVVDGHRAATKRGLAVSVVNGLMVDAPVVRRAEAILASLVTTADR